MFVWKLCSSRSCFGGGGGGDNGDSGDSGNGTANRTRGAWTLGTLKRPQARQPSAAGTPPDAPPGTALTDTAVT